MREMVVGLRERWDRKVDLDRDAGGWLVGWVVSRCCMKACACVCIGGE